VVTPLVQSVNFLQEPGTGNDLRYTRYGNTPNATVVQERLALLEGAEAALALSSGMGATACAMLALLRPGDHLVSSAWLYGGTHKLFRRSSRRSGSRPPSSTRCTRADGGRRYVRPRARCSSRAR
jgi:O-acetylhomoserine/O-acetylserine sulfhydrylase-like pyridoxal-dependent enzyme